MSHVLTTEEAVRKRYADAALTSAPDLCCAVADYDPQLLKAIPEAVLCVDHGCGNPAKWASSGETVIDLGSGSGKICYILAQVVGASGRVIGVDFNPPMLDIARKGKNEFVQNVGFDNIDFRNGRIQDLRLDLDALGEWLHNHPATDTASLLELNEYADSLRADNPLILSESVDLIVSNCVLNLVRNEEKEQLFQEMHRTLKPGGRCVISDIVSDEPIPQDMQKDPTLWSGCISGAFVESEFLQAFENAGFCGIEIVERHKEPWQIVQGIEFRSVTVRAFKEKQGPCLDRNQAVIYKGPWKSVTDDDGHTLFRGEPMAVSDKTFQTLSSAPYADAIEPVEPRVEVPLELAKPFVCGGATHRDPRQTKGSDFKETTGVSDCCGEEGCC